MPMPQSSRAVQGYLSAVAATALAFVIQRNVAFLLMDSLHPLRPDRLAIVLAAVLLVTIATGIVALGPWLVVTWLAEKADIRNPWYFALWGAVAGSLLGSLAFALWPGFVTDGEAAPPGLYADRLAADLANVGPTLALSGAVGGLTYWWISGRHATART